jgi:hypothetical protein
LFEKSAQIVNSMKGGHPTVFAPSLQPCSLDLADFIPATFRLPAPKKSDENFMAPRVYRGTGMRTGYVRGIVAHPREFKTLAA